MPPRLLRPKDEISTPSDTAGIDPPNDGKSGKRRAVSSACIPCRRRKSKCDGGVPACSTCVAVYRTECSYDPDSDHRRSKNKIQSLQQRNDALDVIVASLRTLPEQEAVSLLHNLRSDTKSDVIAASLRSNVNLPSTYAAQTLEADFAPQIGEAGPSASASEPTLATTFSASHQQSSRDVTSLDASSWFRTPQDPEHIEHLLELYFSWVHPFHQFFSKEHFIFDFRNGRTENCGIILVYAILAYASHFSDRPPSRSNYFNSATAGDAFFAEARNALDVVEKPKLTTVQALAILSLRETSQGRDSSGYRLAGRAVRMAVEMNLHLPMPRNSQSLDAELRKLTFWGVFNLESICSVGFQKFSCLPRAAISVEKPTATERIESQRWKAYEDDGGNNQSGSSQPSQPITFANQLSQLCELAGEMTNTFYASKDKFNSRALAAIYGRFMEWYEALPEAFWLENTRLPHVIVLHMCYYFCILHLFRPYIKLNLAAADLYPRDTCTEAANQISGLMNVLRSLHGLRRVPVTVISILLSASTIHLLMLPSESAAVNLLRAMHDLQAISINHPLAARSLETIRSFGKKWGIAIPDQSTTSPLQFQNMLPTSPTSMVFPSPAPGQQSSAGSRDRAQKESGSHHGSPFASTDQQSEFDGSIYMPPYQSWAAMMPEATMQQQFDYEEPIGWAAYVAAQQQQQAQQEEHDSRRQSAPEQQPSDHISENMMWQWKR